MKYFYSIFLFVSGSFLAAMGMAFLFFRHEQINYFITAWLFLLVSVLLSWYSYNLYIESRKFSEPMLQQLAFAFRNQNGILSWEKTQELMIKEQKNGKRYFRLLEKQKKLFYLNDKEAKDKNKALVYIPYYQKEKISKCPFCSFELTKDQCECCHASLTVLQNEKFQ